MFEINSNTGVNYMIIIYILFFLYLFKRGVLFIMLVLK